MGQKERIIDFCTQMGISKAEFERSTNLSNGYVNKLKANIGEDKLNDILRVYPQLNRVWLLTGEGEMLKPAISNNHVTINGNENTSNIGGQHINIAIPEKGTQKIIKPDGSVEIQSIGLTEGHTPGVDALNQRIKSLEQVLAEKEKLLDEKDRLIKTKDDMIDMLKVFLNKSN